MFFLVDENGSPDGSGNLQTTVYQIRKHFFNVCMSTHYFGHRKKEKVGSIRLQNVFQRLFLIPPREQMKTRNFVILKSSFFLEIAKGVLHGKPREGWGRFPVLIVGFRNYQQLVLLGNN